MAETVDELDPAREWLSRRTSHESDWPLASLVGLKARSDTTISVVLPALNEQDTVGPIVAAIVADLGRTGLVDEVVVIDSGSTDRTAAVAAAAGARSCHRHGAVQSRTRGARILGTSCRCERWIWGASVSSWRPCSQRGPGLIGWRMRARTPCTP